jgi:hypothetical protein
MITAILNGFRRKDNLKQQLDALNCQTVKPSEVLLWYNNPGEGFSLNFDVVNQTKAAISNHNFGVWARFAFALNARTKYVCMFDDDTIPGSKWFENCLETIKVHQGLLGTNGLICDPNNYHNHQRFGWINPNEQTVQVDLVGHAWFFERDWLSAMWSELPLIDMSFMCGEDMHFSYTLQKYRGLNTYVPPHPISDKSLWGSLNGWTLGTDQQAISLRHVHNSDQTFRTEVHSYFKLLQSKGWKLILA